MSVVLLAGLVLTAIYAWLTRDWPTARCVTVFVLVFLGATAAFILLPIAWRG